MSLCKTMVSLSLMQSLEIPKSCSCIKRPCYDHCCGWLKVALSNMLGGTGNTSTHHNDITRPLYTTYYTKPPLLSMTYLLNYYLQMVWSLLAMLMSHFCYVMIMLCFVVQVHDWFQSLWHWAAYCLPAGERSARYSTCRWPGLARSRTCPPGLLLKEKKKEFEFELV